RAGAAMDDPTGRTALPGGPSWPPHARRPNGPLASAATKRDASRSTRTGRRWSVAAAGEDAHTRRRRPGRPAPAARSALPLVRPLLPAAAPPGVPAPPPASSRPPWITTQRGQRAMVTPPEIEAQVLRYYHPEKWTAGPIARQLHL